jgi:hypothetical protein
MKIYTAFKPNARTKPGQIYSPRSRILKKKKYKGQKVNNVV